MDADERKLQRRLYATPKLQYIMTPKKVTVAEVSRIWHEKQGDGYAEGTLHTQAANEGWVDLRKVHQAELETQSAKAQLAATGESAAMIVERYSSVLGDRMESVVTYLEAHPAEFKTTDKAIDALCKLIALDHKVRGLDSINMTIADVSPGWIRIFDRLGIRTPGNGNDTEHDGGENAPEVLN